MHDTWVQICYFSVSQSKSLFSNKHESKVITVLPLEFSSPVISRHTTWNCWCFIHVYLCDSWENSPSFKVYSFIYSNFTVTFLALLTSIKNNFVQPYFTIYMTCSVSKKINELFWTGVLDWRLWSWTNRPFNDWSDYAVVARQELSSL